MSEDAVIVSVARTAVGIAAKGGLAHTRAEDLCKAAFAGAIGRARGLVAADVDDIVMGCAAPEGEQGLNVARIAALHAGFPASVPAMTVSRSSASGLQAIAIAAERIAAGGADTVVAGGVESMSRVPPNGFRPSPHPALMDRMPHVYIDAGHSAELVAAKHGVTREEQDRFALESHRRAHAAVRAGKFKDEIVPVETVHRGIDDNGVMWEKRFTFMKDEGVRVDATLEALAALPPAFAKNGTVTAGNSAQLSDGAAAAVVMNRRKAERLRLRPVAALRAYAVAGGEPEWTGTGPASAILQAVKAAGLTLADVSLFEINEAFAAQCIPVIRELGLDPELVNVNGGAIALGHPLGCTGAKLTATLIHELRRRGGKIGVVSTGVGGGMAAAGVFEII